MREIVTLALIPHPSGDIPANTSLDVLRDYAQGFICRHPDSNAEVKVSRGACRFPFRGPSGLTVRGVVQL